VYTGSDDEVVDMLGKAVTLRASGSAAATIIDGQGTRRCIQCNSGESASTVIEGFTITSGYRPLESGGGILCDGGGPTISDCVISDNSTGTNGGGVACTNAAHPIISGCSITANACNFDGAGVYCAGSSEPTLIDCEIRDSGFASLGGGVAIYSSSHPVFVSCTISENAATYTPHGGGGVYCAAAAATFHNCTISNNAAAGAGAGVRATGSNLSFIDCDVSDNSNSMEDDSAGVYASGAYSAMLSGCLIAQNTGGGIGLDASGGHINNCWIQNNTIVGAEGGGIRLVSGSSPAITDCTIWKNSSDDGIDSLGNGGGLACRDSSNPLITRCVISENLAGWSIGMGGGIDCVDSNPVLVECTISSNTASSAGGGIRVAGDSAASLVDTTIAFNYAPYGGGVLAGGTGSLTMDACDVSRNVATVQGGGMYIFDAPTVLLTNSEVTRNEAPSGAGISSGPTAPLFIEGSRIWCNTVDQITGDWTDLGDVLIAETCPLDCPDITLDGLVGVEDLMAVLVDWGTATASDVDASGDVDMVDLAAVIDAWGPC